MDDDADDDARLWRDSMPRGEGREAEGGGGAAAEGEGGGVLPLWGGQEVGVQQRCACVCVCRQCVCVSVPAATRLGSGPR